MIPEICKAILLALATVALLLLFAPAKAGGYQRPPVALVAILHSPGNCPAPLRQAVASFGLHQLRTFCWRARGGEVELLDGGAVVVRVPASRFESITEQPAVLPAKE